MKLALISFEYPPAVAVGGIGTYAWQASHLLAEHGYHIEVFAAGRDSSEEAPHPRIRVQRVAATSRLEFSSRLVPFLREAHGRKPFDVIEAPEIGPEGAPAFEALPQVARVVKLHTPTFLVSRSGYEPPLLRDQIRFWAGSLRRGRWRVLRQAKYRRADDPEFHGARLADEIAAPSRAIGEILTQEWSLDARKVHSFPLPFRPKEDFINLPIPEKVGTIGFLGRLEPRKGVLEMAAAIPGILARAPHLRFRFIGPSWPFQNSDMATWIRNSCARYSASLEFAGSVEPRLIPSELAKCDALVLPSRWENFPFACWEALASGRAVIGSSSGGMAEVIEPGRSGLLVPPRSPEAITRAVLELSSTPGMVAELGAAGRARVLSLLDPERVLPLQCESYLRAIQEATRRNTRP